MLVEFSTQSHPSPGLGTLECEDMLKASEGIWMCVVMCCLMAWQERKQRLWPKAWLRRESQDHLIPFVAAGGAEKGYGFAMEYHGVLFEVFLFLGFVWTLDLFFGIKFPYRFFFLKLWTQGSVFLT